MAARLRPLSRFLCQKPSPPQSTKARRGTPRQADQQGLGPKRFYKHVDIARVPESRHYAITVDDKTVKTVHGTALTAGTKPLALAIAAEWDAQTERIRPSSMPLTSLLSASLDVIPCARARTHRSLLRYLDTDTVCIRPAHPVELVAHQDAAFAPVMDALSRAGIEMKVVRGELAAPQTDATRSAVGKILASLDDLSLAAVEAAAGCAKSVGIAVALREGVAPDVACRAARSEEEWQVKVWGSVEGGHDLDEADLLLRLSAANAIFQFVQMDRSAFVRSAGGEA